ncbi:bcl-2-like protein 11 [Amia ocellicauda]|uniref:bcl-2-like protein 11 n=1 Tax=Amia ocellicauda TaxID=2972642 RepID=UPI003464B9CB
MSDLSRGQKKANGPTTLDCERGEGGELQPGPGARCPQSSALAPPDSVPSRSGEADPTRGGITMPHSPRGYASRFPLFSSLSRSSSGYFSFDYDSLPSSPPMSHNKSTQTPSPSSQAIAHAQRRISREQDPRQHHEMPPDTQEVWVAQELRRIGDEFNTLYLQRGNRDRNGRVAQYDFDQVHNNRNFCLWVTILVRRLIHILMWWR